MGGGGGFPATTLEEIPGGVIGGKGGLLAIAGARVAFRLAARCTPFFATVRPFAKTMDS